MRLRDYQELIERALPIIATVEIITNGNNAVNPTFIIKNIQPFLKVLVELKDAQLEKDMINNLLNIPNFKNSIESQIIVSQNTKTNFASYKDSLYKTLSNFKITLKNVLSEENPNTLNIKLPDEYSSIKEYVSFFSDLESICHPFNYIQQDITVVNFDVGSKWLGLDFTDSMSASFFVALAGKSIDLVNKVLETRKLVAEIEKNKAEENAANIKSIDTVIDIINKNQKKELENYKTQLIQEATNLSKFVLKEGINQNEFDNFVRIALDKLGGLLIRGMEIVPALNAKPEVKQLSQETTTYIEEKRKLIIGCDHMKYITVQSSNLNSRDIPADTLEMNSNET